MSLIFPKKPLYAPMLGTLGGGSARGFGRGLGAGSLFEFEEIYMEPGTPSSSFARTGFDSLAYFSNPNGTNPAQTVAATTINPDTSDYYFAKHASQNKFMYVVPQTRAYNFEIQGAQGGSYTGHGTSRGGRGAKYTGTIDLVQGDVLHFIVGLAPINSTDAGESPGGGGASAIYKANWDETADNGMTIIAIAGGGGGAVGSSYGPYIGGDASTAYNGGWSVSPTGGGYMAVNTTPGGGGLGGNSTDWDQFFGSGVTPVTYNNYVAYGSNIPSTSGLIGDNNNYNGVAGGGGWLQQGHTGHNSAYGGQALYANAYGGNAGTSHNVGGFGGGGGGRNTAGGGGGGYIGGSGGYYSNGSWSGAGNVNQAGGVGGTSYFNSSFGSNPTAGYGPTTSSSSRHCGYIRLY